MIRSAAFALLLSSAWLISAGPGIAAPASAGQHWTFAASTTTHHKIKHRHHRRHVVHGRRGGGLPKPIGDVVRSERTLNKPTDGGPSNFHPKTAPVHHWKKHRRHPAM
ncbi:hypothetical protein [Labrys wisconsinensis]|uniref:Uncharacterized protein n=1 Tax=Labrys wisconsinensis TaxID=425677 RepID=A0ABU0JJE1_9HYPH|nr:hypothetical protein [Labrys wisconsinensis]MDQ0473384.1 hypothetical protein [Labrys wisconsinensis]